MHANMTNDCVLDLSELTEVSVTENLVKGEKLIMTAGIKNSRVKSKGQCKDK